MVDQRIRDYPPDAWHTPDTCAPMQVIKTQQALTAQSIHRIELDVTRQGQLIDTVERTANEAKTHAEWAVNAILTTEKRIDRRMDGMDAQMVKLHEKLDGKAIRENAILVAVVLALLGIIAQFVVK